MARPKLIQTALYFASFVLLGGTFAIVGPTLSSLAAHAQVGLAEISIVFTAHATGYLAGSLLSGRVFDRMRGHPILAVSLLCITAIMVAMPLLKALWLLVAVLFLLGMVGSSIDVGGNTMLVWTHGRSVGPFMNALHLMFGVGGLLSPLLVSLAFRTQGDVHAAYWVLAALAVPIALFAARVPSPAHGDADARRDLGQTRNTPLVLLLVLFFFTIVAAESGVSGWLSTYAMRFGASEVTAALVTSAFWGAFTLGRVLAIPIAMRATPERMLVGGVVIALVGMGLLVAGGGAMPTTWAGAIAAGLGIASLFATGIAYAEGHMEISGSVTSFFLGGGSVGSMVMPLIIGSAFERYGPQALPVIMLAVLGLGALTLFATFRVAQAAPVRPRAADV